MNSNSLIQALLGQLQSKNPQGYQIVKNMMNNGGSADAYVKQMLGRLNSEQKQQILNTAKGYGCPDDYLSKLQNSK